MKKIKIITLTAVTLILGCYLSQPVCAKSKGDFKVASVDVQKVVFNSSQIKNLKIEQRTKILELQKFVQNAKADLAKEKNEVKRKALEDGYNKELNVKKAAIDKEYASKVMELDKIITEKINLEAKKLGYDLVLTKTSVLSGADDITEEIIKIVK